MIICSLLMGKTLSSIQGECFAFYAVKYLFILLLLTSKQITHITVLKFSICKYLLRIYIRGPTSSVSKDKMTKRCGKSYLHSFFVKKLFSFQVEKAEFLSKMLWKEITKYVAVVKFQNCVMTNVDKTGLSIQLN